MHITTFFYLGYLLFFCYACFFALSLLLSSLFQAISAYYDFLIYSPVFAHSLAVSYVTLKLLNTNASIS
jgi:hypothetical protein